MVFKLFLAFCLMAVCVVIHTAGVTRALSWLRRFARPGLRRWPGTRLLIGLAAWTILLHLAEIATWGVFYAWMGAMPDLPTAWYFSAVTYTTTGYGDLILPAEWRLLGAIEALTGILMCGLSTGFFFAVVGRLYQLYDERAQP
jgi:voltage-gated potassium channel Kch